MNAACYYYLLNCSVFNYFQLVTNEDAIEYGVSPE